MKGGGGLERNKNEGKHDMENYSMVNISGK